MKFNYQFEEGNESDSEFLDNQVSTSFIFDKSERGQLKNLRKWLADMNINHAVTRIRDENGDKKYCIVVYEDVEEDIILDDAKSKQEDNRSKHDDDKSKEESTKKSKKKNKKKSNAVDISE